MSAAIPSGPLHFRAALRLKVDYQTMPSKKFTDFKFYDASAQFAEDEIRKRGEYIHRLRQARWEIHNHARMNFLKDVVDLLTPLNVKHAIVRELVDNHRVEIHTIAYDKTCILLVLRNWVNNLHDVEITRIVKALRKCAHRLRSKYEHVWKYIVAPAFEKAQTRLDGFAGIQLYPCLPYILPRALVTCLAERCGVDYSYAYPSVERWQSGLTELFRDTLARLLGLRARTTDPALAQDSSTPAKAYDKTHTLHIDPIKPQTPPEAPRSPVFDTDPPPPRARAPPTPSNMRKEEDVAASAPIPSASTPVPTSTAMHPPVPLHASNPYYPLMPDRPHQRTAPLLVDYSRPLTERARRINFLYAYALEHNINSERQLTEHAARVWSVQRRTAREYAQLAAYRLRRLSTIEREVYIQ